MITVRTNVFSQAEPRTPSSRLPQTPPVGTANSMRCKQERLLGISEVMAQLGVKRWKVLKLIEEGRLLKVKLGRRALVTQSSIDQLIGALVEKARRQHAVGL